MRLTSFLFSAAVLAAVTSLSAGPKKLVLQYGDGSANQYIVTKEDKITLEYRPVKPEFSSSGIYDGGDAYKIELKKKDFRRLYRLFKKAAESKKDQTRERQKGTGQIHIKEDLKRTRYVLKRNSGLKRKIEKALKSFKAAKK